MYFSLVVSCFDYLKFINVLIQEILTLHDTMATAEIHAYGNHVLANPAKQGHFGDKHKRFQLTRCHAKQAMPVLKVHQRKSSLIWELV